MGFKVVVMAVAVTGGGWLVWKNQPPYSLGTHEAESVVEAKTNSSGAASGPRVGNCEVLPADNVWNTPIDKLHKDPRSDAYVGSMGPLIKLHPDFASDLGSGIPYSEIPANTRAVHVNFEYADESDLGSYPIPKNAPVEGGGNPNGDRHIILIDQRRCILYELFATTPKPDGTWDAGSGEKYDMLSNQIRPEGMGSADAAGLQIFPGLVRYDEVAAGEINHALRFTIPHTQAAFVWPGRHKASRITDTKVAPMGARFRLRQDYDISRFSKSNQVILTALKRYGMFLADNGGPLFLSGVPDKRWDDSDLHLLTKVTAEDFEAVDESEWWMLPNSARVDPVALGR
ncbi:MAG: hypothetical protein M3O02_12950 [Acidobacteriota bacterium]|nr:hypothetical protein [Acidobacteriota bacterium]